MAYPGGKKKHVDLLKVANLPRAKIIVDGFYGSGGLSWAYQQAYGEDSLVVAGESFGPLRKAYVDGRSVETLAYAFRQSLVSHGLAETWKDLRDALAGEPSLWTPADAFCVLLNLGYGNSMRHGKGRHNIKPCPSKVKALLQRKPMELIDPIALEPDRIYVSWQSALGSVRGPNATFLGDPPYQQCSKIYPSDDWRSCAVPPVEMAMEKDYGCILMFNNFSQELHQQYQDLALQYGYSLEGRSTDWQTRFKAGSQPKSEEWIWIFKP